MNWLRLILALIAWSGFLVLQYVLMRIAHFFQQNSGKRTWYPFYLVTMALSAVGAGRYIWRIPKGGIWPDFTGDPIANLCLFSAGAGLLLLGSSLYTEMMGKS